MMEYNYGGRTIPHMPAGLDFKKGKLYANERPGLGVEIDFKPLTQIAEFTQPITYRAQTLFPAGWVDYELVAACGQNFEQHGLSLESPDLQ